MKLKDSRSPPPPTYDDQTASGAESYEELESRGQRIRHILESTDSFHSDTPTNAANRGEGGRRGSGGGGTFSSAVSQEGRVMVAFTLKEASSWKWIGVGTRSLQREGLQNKLGQLPVASQV